MARGWESKSVEQQQDLASADKKQRTIKTPEQAKAEQELTSLRLTRARVEQQMAAATNDRYRQMLKMELEALNEKIEAISGR